ncbi:MAG TPA: hypothetical protein VF815_28840 [Myxococcaceae bacterium]|jgi:hypothetical protein
MRPTALLLCLLALLGLSGCPAEEECIDCEVTCERPPTPFMPQMPGILLTGRKSVVQIQNARLGTCGGVAVSERSTLTAEVTDPDGRLLAQETFDERLAIAHFGFTVQRPGLHHFLVAFEPPGALIQFDLDAAIDRSGEASSLLPSGECTSLERTRSGAWVCDSAFYRGDTRVAGFQEARVAVAEDVVWVASEERILRYVDTGSELTLTGSLAHTHGAVEFLLASAGELVALHGRELVRYSASGGALQASDPAAWNHTGNLLSPTGPRGILLRDGDRLALITSNTQPPGSLLQLCPYQLTASGPVRTAQPCQQLPGNLAGFEPTVLWTKRELENSSSFSLHRWLWSTNGLVEQTSLGLGFRLQLTPQSFRRSTVVPVVQSLPLSVPFEHPSRHAVVAWSPQWRSLVLEHMDEQATTPSASSSLYWGALPPSAQNPTLRIRSR